MVDFVSPLDNPPIVSSASSSGAVNAANNDDEDLENACSICLEPFNSDDPHTVTNCKHDYHLQCILEWSQRSKECPICWQLLVLKDPASQELLDVVKIERELRSRCYPRHTYEDNVINHDISSTEDSDFDVHIMRHFAAAAHRARYVNRRGRERSSCTGPSELLHSVHSEGPPHNVQHRHSSPEEHQSSSLEFSVGDLPNPGILIGTNAERPSSMVQDIMNMEPNSVDDRDSLIKPSRMLPESPQRSSSTEFRAVSESIKSKFSSASARYKESISKGTRGLKEKLLARNITVKELGKGVQRDMNAGITGVARMFERLDVTAKRTGESVPLSSSSYKGKDMQERSTVSPNAHTGETTNDTSSASPPYAHSVPSGQIEVSIAQSGN